MSTDRFPRGKTAIVAASTYGMGEAPGYSSMDLATAASLKPKPAADKKPATKSAKTQTEKPAQVKADDLTIVEGIGPKIADLLKAAGIATFAQLAASKPAAIKAILETAGKRYQMHDPATWPKQAALARDGKSAELAKLQGELKAGK